MRRKPLTVFRAVAMGGVGALVAGLLVVLAPAVGVTPTDSAEAAPSGSQFNAGYIVSDANFYDGSAMNASQIQAFLASQVPVCDYSRAQMPCLKDYAQATPTLAANLRCAPYQGSSSDRASDIIAKVGVACGFSPKAMLVLLQKEQSLVTDSWPYTSQYSHATGYGCPDTAPCDPAYNGFFYQVYWAAYAFQAYKANGGGPNYKTGRWNTIQWHPNAGCGSSSVYIENYATAGLYNYTPYRPNDAALSNLYGTGDGCSSYGNRNFWRLWWDWFGDPAGTPPAHGSFDTATAVIGGIRITGWSIDPYANITQPSYFWVDIDGTGRAGIANKPLNWIEGLYPGAGPNHGIDEIIPTTPGTHQVCVSNTKLLGCKTVTVPASGSALGALESVSVDVGSITVSGWAADASNPSAVLYPWVTVDGAGAPAAANLPSPAAAAVVPAIGANHGFSKTIPATAGQHTVCAFGLNSIRLGCEVVFVPKPAAGSLTVQGVPGGIEVSGWALDRRTAASTYVWIDVSGTGQPLFANQPSPAALAAYPALGTNHGFSATIKKPSGTYQVCLFGVDSIVISCQAVTVPSSGAGVIDAMTPGRGHLRITGWALDRSSTQSIYPWVDIDGVGRPIAANVPLNWINDYFGGTVGPNHGIDTTLVLTPGPHRVCVYGLDGVEITCQTVDIPMVGSFDTATAERGGIRVTGWAAHHSTDEVVYPWINVDGSGRGYTANKPVAWLPAHDSTLSVGHGFDEFIPASVGNHQVCAFGASSISLGCRTVTVHGLGAFDSATGVPGGIRVTGWAVPEAGDDVVYPWVNIDGSGGPVAANKAVAWLPALYSANKVGVNHGFDSVVAAAPGPHQVCIVGTGGASLGCKTVTVPAS